MTKKAVLSKPIKKQTMAEQMADRIKELILSGELQANEVLPTEPELCEQFGVSRAVVRDATRILMALGLVDVKHGAGVFVTDSQSPAFGEALLLALQRSEASAWDVEQFEQIMLPELVALAATAATDAEIAEIRERVEHYHEILLAFHTRRWQDQALEVGELEAFLAASLSVFEAIFQASHNLVFQQLARPLLNLRNLRSWQSAADDTPESLTEIEMFYFNGFVEAIASRQPAEARRKVQQLMTLPPEAVAAMQQTPVGQRPQIPLTFSKLKEYLQSQS